MTQIEETSASGLINPSKVSTLLREAFFTAYIITCSEFVAEQLVGLAIELLEPTQLQSAALVAETLKFSLEFARGKQNPGNPVAACLALGDELAALMELEVGIRCSYVARVLLGYSLAECVELLKTDAVTITRNLLTATRCLCDRDRERRSISQFLPLSTLRVKLIDAQASPTQAPELLQHHLSAS